MVHRTNWVIIITKDNTEKAHTVSFFIFCNKIICQAIKFNYITYKNSIFQ